MVGRVRGGDGGGGDEDGDGSTADAIEVMDMLAGLGVLLDECKTLAQHGTMQLGALLDLNDAGVRRGLDAMDKLSSRLEELEAEYRQSARDA
jgi:hypothetical protein